MAATDSVGIKQTHAGSQYCATMPDTLGLNRNGCRHDRIMMNHADDEMMTTMTMTIDDNDDDDDDG